MTRIGKLHDKTAGGDVEDRGRIGGGGVVSESAQSWRSAFPVLYNVRVSFGRIIENVRRRFSPRQSPTESERKRYGLDLNSGDRHYRAWVGPPEEYGEIAALQVTLMLAAGLLETHKLCDVGCGSLRAGRMLIPYLRPGNYHGIEPEQWLVEEGVENELGQSILEAKRNSGRFASNFPLEDFGVPFDFVVAQSVFSHTHPDLLQLGLSKIAAALADNGKLLATWNEGYSTKQGSGWIHKGIKPCTWEEMRDYAAKSGLAAMRLKWPHPRQSWFVAARSEETINGLATSLRTPRPGWGRKRPWRKK